MHSCSERVRRANGITPRHALVHVIGQFVIDGSAVALQHAHQRYQLLVERELARVKIAQNLKSASMRASSVLHHSLTHSRARARTHLRLSSSVSDETAAAPAPRDLGDSAAPSSVLYRFAHAHTTSRQARIHNECTHWR
jgi:hypothetical protein